MFLVNFANIALKTGSVNVHPHHPLEHTTGDSFNA